MSGTGSKSLVAQHRRVIRMSAFRPIADIRITRGTANRSQRHHAGEVSRTDRHHGGPGRSIAMIRSLSSSRVPRSSNCLPQESRIIRSAKNDRFQAAEVLRYGRTSSFQHHRGPDGAEQSRRSDARGSGGVAHPHDELSGLGQCNDTGPIDGDRNRRNGHGRPRDGYGKLEHTRRTFRT